MMKALLLLALVALHACAHPSPGKRMPSSASSLPWGLEESEIPEPTAINRWLDPKYEYEHAPALDSLRSVEATCAGKNLYPAHPQQSTKIYHVYRRAEFNALKVPPASPLCRISSKGAKKVCLRADSFDHVVLSDIYADDCGHFYRAFWKESFLHRDESMGTLLSRGRTVYPNPKSEFAEDVVEGATYPVEITRFLFLTETFPHDEQASAKLRKQAETTHFFDPRTHLFQKR